MKYCCKTPNDVMHANVYQGSLGSFMHRPSKRSLIISNQVSYLSVTSKD